MNIQRGQDAQALDAYAARAALRGVGLRVGGALAANSLGGIKVLVRCAGYARRMVCVGLSVVASDAGGAAEGDAGTLAAQAANARRGWRLSRAAYCAGGGRIGVVVGRAGRAGGAGRRTGLGVRAHLARCAILGLGGVARTPRGALGTDGCPCMCECAHGAWLARCIAGIRRAPGGAQCAD